MSRDCAIALQSGQQEQNSISKKKKKKKEEEEEEKEEEERRKKEEGGGEGEEGQGPRERSREQPSLGGWCGLRRSV